tara:strand:+ start:4007 stop:4450 length:444 start_codon:yes stop_codon:yes gene_type:complete
MKLQNVKCSIHKLDSNNKFFVDIVNIKDSPWVTYLEKKNTEPLYNSFKATQSHPDWPNDYWYDIKDFDKLVESIKKYGYVKELCNNETFQNNFNGKNWKGGKGPVKIMPDGNIYDGHHRCAIFYFLYGPEYELNIKNTILQNIPPIN